MFIYYDDHKLGNIKDAFNRKELKHLLKKHTIKVNSDLLSNMQWHSTPVLLPGKSYGWRSLVGCSPWGREESDTTE